MNDWEKNENSTLRELKKISKILLLAHASAIEREISKIANTDARKKMWVLINGKRMPKDIANEVGVTPMAVSYFLNAAAAAELIEYSPRKPPCKILNYVPPSWIELVTPTVEREKDKETKTIEEEENG